MMSVETACLVALCLFAIVSTGNGFPQESADQGQPLVNTLFDELPEQPHQAAAENHRHKRATCDLLSGFGVNDSACATHCILRGNRGGYCNAKKVCVCRN